MKLIPVGDLYAKVDDEHFEKVEKLNWSKAKRGEIIYAQAHPPNTHRNAAPILMHTFIFGVLHPDWQYDHRNRNGLDNQSSNVRIATSSQNLANRPKNPNKSFSSQYKGVTWDKEKKKWRAQITVNRCVRTIGRFHNEEEAAIAYNEAALKAWGEFAFLNAIPAAKTQSNQAKGS